MSDKIENKITDMLKLKEGIISATLGLKDMLEAEDGASVHFLQKLEFQKIEGMIDFLTDLYLWAERDTPS